MSNIHTEDISVRKGGEIVVRREAFLKELADQIGELNALKVFERFRALTAALSGADGKPLTMEDAEEHLRTVMILYVKTAPRNKNGLVSLNWVRIEKLEEFFKDIWEKQFRRERLRLDREQAELRQREDIREQERHEEWKAMSPVKDKKRERKK